MRAYSSGGPGLRHARHERTELQLAEEFEDAVAVVGPLVRAEVEFERQVAADRRQLLGGDGGPEVLFQRLARLRRLDLLQVILHRLDRAELGDQRLGRLVADPWHPGDVVGGVADERLVVGDERRIEAEALTDGLGVVGAEFGEGIVRAGCDDFDAIADKLQQVGVAGDDGDVIALGGGLGREGADHVVGLEAAHLADRDGERLHQLADARHLRPQLVGHRRAVGLVVGAQVVAESAPDVEGHHDLVGAIALQHRDQHQREAEDGVGRLPLRRREVGAHGVERAESEAVAVDQQQRRALRLRRCRGCRFYLRRRCGRYLAEIESQLALRSFHAYVRSFPRKIVHV
jgi:hypothetical protein